VAEELYTSFLLGIAPLLKGKNRVKLLRLALRLSDAGSLEYSRILYELCPYLSVDEKRAYGTEVMKKGNSTSLSNLVTLTSCFEYLRKDEAAKIIRTYIEMLGERSSSVDSDAATFLEGFKSYSLQQALATVVDHEIDSVSTVANIARQEELLDKARVSLKGSPLWSARIKLADAWLSYSRALLSSTGTRSELLDGARKEALTALKSIQKVDDHLSSYSGHRLLFIIGYRKFLALNPKEKKTNNLLRQMRRDAELSVRAAENLVDPAKLAGAYTNAGIALRHQAERERDLMQRRRTLFAARELHLKAVSTARSVNDELVPLHLYNAGADLIALSRNEPDIARLTEIHETVLKEMDEVIKLSNSSTEPGIRASALSVKLNCMDELSAMNPVTITKEVLAELDQLSNELDELQSQTRDKRIFAHSFMYLSLHCLRLLRASGANQKELIQKAETNALKAYEIAKQTENYSIMGLILYNTAGILTVKGIVNHDLSTLEDAIDAVGKSCRILAEIGDLGLPLCQSLATEIHIVKYGYTGRKKELNDAIASSSNSISYWISKEYFQLAAEESFRLATVYMLIDEDKKAEAVLNEAAKLFRRSGKRDPKFKKVYDNFSATCKATSKLVRAQIAYRAGQQSTAKHLVGQAEQEMIRANARWREVWLIRGFKELVSGNLVEAKRNLARVIEGSLDVLEDQNPTTTGHTAKKLVSFIEQDRDRKKFPPTVIDLPLRGDLVLAALKLDRISQQLSSVPSLARYSEQQELSVEEIRDLIKRMMKVDRKSEKSASK
jgi:hypothetical protein